MILDEFTAETFTKLWDVGWVQDSDSYRINEKGDIVFFSTYKCDHCNKLLGGPNPLIFLRDDKPYTLENVYEVFEELNWWINSPNLRNYYFKMHKHTHRPNVYEETLEPFEITGGYGCYDCKSKLDN